MDDLLYILIGIIWLVLGIYRNNQKNKSKGSKLPSPSQKTISPTSNNPKTKTVKEIFDDFFPDPETPKEEKPFNYEDIESTEEAVPQLYTIKSYSLENEENVNQYKREIEGRLNEEKTSDSEENREVNEEIEGFEARKAIIYSAIIQRPYN